ncbi:hypothetical protein evm_000787 [Chilo suppressalis]|nr:hypothetical protein evm_000787 [Chilo suppressalis]
MQFEYDPERLIEEVKKRPGIWDFEDAEYRAKNVRHQLWSEVVTELLNTDVKVSKSEMRELEIQLQKKWKSIRDCFQKYVQNPNRTKKPYIYNKQLQFLLKNHITRNDGYFCDSDSEEAPRQPKVWKPKRRLNLRKDDDQSSEEENNEVSDNDSIKYLNEDVEAPPSKVRKHSKPTTEEFVFASVEPKSDSDDPDRMFLLSLLPHFKSIPEEMRINVKMDLMQVLRNANFGYTSSSREQKLF